MPQLGLTMTEGSVSEWIKKPGDKVKKNEILFIVATDKAEMEVESNDAGILVQVVVEAGKAVPVGTVIAYIETPAHNSPAASASGAAPATSAAPASDGSGAKKTSLTSEADAGAEVGGTGSGLTHTPSVANGREGPPASPRARRLARELGIDIASIKSKGLGARIVEKDVRDAADAQAGSHAIGAVAVSGVASRPAVTSLVPTTPQSSSVDSNRRRVIAQKLTESIQTIPHFSVAVEVDAQHLLAMHEGMKEQDKTSSTHSQKLTLTDLLLKALALALREVPEANASWIDGNRQPRTTVDLGLAVATDRGVVAPLIRNVDRTSLSDLIAQRSGVVEKARRGRLSVTDLEGAVGTLTNLGMYGVDNFSAIISPGQGFILAVGKIKNRPWVEGAALVTRPTVMLNLSMDHRIADGVVAARLLASVAGIIEKPYRIIGTLNGLTGK